MRKYLVILFILWIGVWTYGYIQNPGACKKLAADMAADLPPIFTPTPATSQAFSTAWSSRGTSLVNWVRSAGSTNSASATEPIAETKSSATTPSSATSATNQASPASSAPVPAPPNPPTAAVPPPAPALVATPEQLAALAAWTTPPSIPSNADWTWTTSQGVFHDVQIVRVEADCVTIIHHDGGGLVPISELPADLQKQLNYNPDAAAAAAAQRQQEELASAKELAKEQSPSLATDYQGALAAAKSSGKLVMLHFTGSDWCPYCKMLESEVLSTSSFGNFARANYVFLTVDFPHNTPQPNDVKQQNQALAQKFAVTGYPTLVVIDGNEKELGRVSGYNPGSGPDAVISQLKSFH